LVLQYSAVNTRRFAPLLAVLALFGVTLTGCSLTDQFDLETRLTDEGYQSVYTEYGTTNGRTTLTVWAETTPRNWEQSDIDAIGRIVWETFPREIEWLELVLNESVAAQLDAEELESRYGARPDGFVKDDTGVIVVLVVLAAVVLLGVIGAVVLLVVVLRRQHVRAQQMLGRWPPGYR
jgi:hypothetical protein